MKTLFQDLDSGFWFFCCLGNFLFHQNPSVERKDTIVYLDHDSFSDFEIRRWSSFFLKYSAIAHVLMRPLAVNVIVSDCGNNTVSLVVSGFLVASVTYLSCLGTSSYFLFFGYLLLLSHSNQS